MTIILANTTSLNFNPQGRMFFFNWEEITRIDNSSSYALITV